MDQRPDSDETAQPQPPPAISPPTSQLGAKPPPAKVIIRFKAVGNAPILKRNFFKINSALKFQAIIMFLRKELSYKPSDPLGFIDAITMTQFVYISSAFSPAPDETIENLYRCFETEGQLIVNYCTTAAWG
ncbi:Ubiquitin-like protein [Dimargaris verticillata]|uniref:Ubiquitin-like protein ATG12 n=1 Tax=Dimargaris verticillata TaxID=2761393 RepID=A0A9W8AZI3_9FUNG|nr:Ubiquitin-like protein [Dimargaris verticillata]